MYVSNQKGRINHVEVISIVIASERRSSIQSIQLKCYITFTSCDVSHPHKLCLVCVTEKTSDEMFILQIFVILTNSFSSMSDVWKKGILTKWISEVIFSLRHVFLMFFFSFGICDTWFRIVKVADWCVRAFLIDI